MRSYFACVAIATALLTGAANAAATCDERFIRINAMFIHATVVCGVDFIHSAGGYIALHGAKLCAATRDNAAIMKESKAAMEQFDKAQTALGREGACHMADQVRQDIEAGKF